MTERSASTNGPGCDPGPLSFAALKQLRFHGRLLRFGGRFERGQVSCELVRACVDTARLAGHRVERKRNRLRQPSPLKGAFVGKPERLPQALTAHSRVGARRLSLGHGVLVGCGDSRLIATCGGHSDNPGIIRRFPTPKRRMRTADDLAYRARNWLWYWRVRQVSGLSNQQLDEKAFGDVERKRHFERIQHTASSPDRVALLGGRTLLEAVDQWTLPKSDAAQPFAEATAAFRSRLWEFLARRDIAPAEYTRFIEDVVAARGWHRAQAQDLGLYREFLGDMEPAIGPPGGTAYSAMLHRLVNDAKPESLAVLIALFREALYGVRLEEALLIKSAVTTAVGWMCHQLRLPESLERLLDRLVDDRILANVWITEADWRAHTGRRAGLAKNSRDRLAEFRAWVEWYVERRRPRFEPAYCLSPIVPSAPRVDWLEANRGLLEQAYRDIMRTNGEGQFRLLGTGQIVDAPWLDRAQFSAQLAKALGRPETASPQFYSDSPPLLMGRLPNPY